MTGDPPQPGETPSSQGNPWTFADPDTAWWHGEPDREPPEHPAAAAGAGDTVAHFTGDAEGSRLATANELMIIEPGGSGAPESGGSDGAPGVPESETTDRNRPTVALTPHRPPAAASPPVARLEKPAPASPQAGTHLETPAASPQTGTHLETPAASPQTEARLEKMENSTFWLSEEERAARAAGQPDRRPGRRRRPPTHNPASALIALVALGMLAAFFAWVSAEPFWLAAGHGDKGYATTTRCHGDGLTQRCHGRFATEDGRFSVARVTLLGVSGESRRAGAITPARMVSPGSGQAYAAPAGPIMHLRWALGFLLVLVCGYGIAEATGARRLGSRVQRKRAVIASFAGPLLLLAGFLIAAY
ncbi:hypothetical protein [Actinoplanes sp. GCM10030250]|uniref:hypothetical protein n=1 Tax=Actinoplanes sp. GCM10030250 TaxID=3273376 RepID=UPI00360F7572